MLLLAKIGLVIRRQAACGSYVYTAGVSCAGDNISMTCEWLGEFLWHAQESAHKPTMEYNALITSMLCCCNTISGYDQSHAINETVDKKRSTRLASLFASQVSVLADQAARGIGARYQV